MKKFTLCGGKLAGPEGPYTEALCRERITEIFGEDWHWSSELADGSYHAQRHHTYELLAEAVLCDM